MQSWDERYAQGKYGSADPHRLLIDLVRTVKPGKALDLACGIGRNAIFLAEKGWLVKAVDYSKVGIELAEKRALARGVAVDFQVADLEKGEFEIVEKEFDLICDFHYLQPDLFEKMKKGVEPGGLIISTIHIYGEGEEPGRFLLRDGELREFFGGFEILHYHETAQTDKDAGEHHRRTAEIIAKRLK